MTLRDRVPSVAVTILYLSFASFPLVLSSSIPFPNVTSINEQGIWKDSYKFTTYKPGQNYKGLSNVKRYFHELGYNIANTPPSNFDDKFDDDLVSSIKVYQKNYNLNPTGKLDRNTLKKLMTPRCGVHSVSHYKLYGTRWGTTQLRYKYIPHPLFTASFKNAVSRAFDTWSRVVKIGFWETYSNYPADITIHFETGNGFTNFDPRPQPWAFAKYPPSGQFYLNTNVTWVSYGDVTRRTEPRAVDVESLALHEIGHLLGLEHSDYPWAVMYQYLEPWTRKVVLTQDDIQGIKTLYNIYP